MSDEYIQGHMESAKTIALRGLALVKRADEEVNALLAQEKWRSAISALVECERNLQGLKREASEAASSVRDDAAEARQHVSEEAANAQAAAAGVGFIASLFGAGKYVAAGRSAARQAATRQRNVIRESQTRALRMYEVTREQLDGFLAVAAKGKAAIRDEMSRVEEDS